MMKKLIATALAAAMIFGLVSVALAAAVDLPDVEDYKWENEVRRLASLGIINGYEDGTFRPENTVSRAEFAKMIVCMLGLENAANLLKGEKGPFADVPGTHWASGYINVAEMKGIVNGYGDGTFKPEGTITYAEALKMILASMGYQEEGFLVVRWPVTWIIQASEIDLDKGVDVLANLPITRGEVAKLFDNSLTKEHVAIKEGEFEARKDVTFMSKLGVKSTTGRVIASPELWGTDYKDNTAIVAQKADGSEEDPVDFAIEDYEGLLGHKVKVWYKGSKVLAVEDLSTEKTLTWKEYDKLTTIGQFFKNFESVGSAKITEVEGQEIVVVYDGSKAVAVKVLEYTTDKVEDIYEYGTTRKDLYLSDFGRLSLADLKVVYKGAADKFADIEKGDIVQYIISETAKIDKAIVVVVRDTFKGTLTELTSAGKLKVDGKIFEAAPEFDNTDLYKKVGSVITLYLNKDGKVFGIKGDNFEPTETIYGVVTSTAVRLVKGDQKTFVSVLTIDGETEYLWDGTGSIKIGDIVIGTVYDDEVSLEKWTEEPLNIKVTDVKTADKELHYKDEGTSKTAVYTADTLWLEGDSESGFVTRPRPYKDDIVDLYVVSSKIVIGIVSED